MNNTFRHGTLFITGGIVGAVVMSVWFLSDDSKLALRVGEGAPASSQDEASSFPTNTSKSLTVIDQKAGTSVTVETLAVPAPGVWVAVREVQGTDLGNILGAARAREPVTSLIIPLLRATVPNRLYVAVLYRDDGNDTFDQDEESVYVDFDTGAPVVATFRTTN